jgi:hypothetical protein
LKCAVVSLYSVVKQRLKFNTGKVCNCLVQLLLTVVFSIEERDFLDEYVFRKGNRYTVLVQEKFAENFPETPVTHRNAVGRRIEKFRGTGSLKEVGDHLNLTIRSWWTFLILRSWTSLPTPFISSQRLSERSV